MKFLPSLSAVLLGLLASVPGEAGDCRSPDRNPDAPPGVRVPAPPGCAPAAKRGQEPTAAQTGREPGFIDLGNGTQVRIGGSVRLEMQHAR